MFVGPQVKGGKIDPWFHAMFASSLLSFGAMYPCALGKCALAPAAAVMPVVPEWVLINVAPVGLQRSTSRRTRPASSGAFSLVVAATS